MLHPAARFAHAPSYRALLLASGALMLAAAGLACAGEAPRPPKFEPIPEPPPLAIGVDNDDSFERGVRLSPRAGDSIEESVIDGKRVIRVHTPGGGEYIIREDLGDGTYARQTPGDTGVRVPMRVIVEF